MLIEQRVSQYLDIIAQRLFWMNKKIDRMKSVLQVKFNMPITANLVHYKIAHHYPLLADMIADWQEDSDQTPIYMQIEESSEYYSTIIELFKQLYEHSLTTRDIILENQKKCEELADIETTHFLEHFLLDYRKYIIQAKLLLDKAESSNSNNYDFDSQIEKWFFEVKIDENNKY